MGKGLKVQVVDMDEEMQQAPIKQITESFDMVSIEDQIANEIKKYMDKQYSPSWNVIVGKNFGSNVVTMTKSYLFCSIHNDEISVLIWKSWRMKTLIVNYIVRLVDQ